MVVSDSENRRQDTPPSSDTSKTHNYHVREVLSSRDLGKLTNTEMVLSRGANQPQVGKNPTTTYRNTPGRY